MSKKYILEVKEEHYGSKYFPKPIGKTQSIIACRYYDKIVNIISDIPSLLTQDEINELPYGFVKMFNIVEVEDKKYYWRKKKEYLCSFEDDDSYLNYDCDHDRLSVDDNEDGFRFKTKFTETEAKELLGDDFEMFERVDI